MDIDLMLKEEKFSILANSLDLKKYLRKFVHNFSRATKSVSGGFDNATVTSKDDH